MIEAQFTYFDTAVITVMLLSCLFAFFRGFVRELLSCVAWIGAGFITVHYYESAAATLAPYFKNPKIAMAVGAGGIFLAALIAFAIFNSFIIKILKSGSSLGTVDNLFGLCFGALRGAFIISLTYFLMSVVVLGKNPPDWLSKSITQPYAEAGAIALVKIAPDFTHEIASMQEKAVDEAKAQRDAAPADNVDQGNDTGSSNLNIGKSVSNTISGNTPTKLLQMLNSTSKKP